MTKKRELDSITPDFSLTPEQVADLKRILVDEEYAKEIREKQKKDDIRYLEKMKEVILTGVSPKYNVPLPESYLNSLRKTYESITGEKLDEDYK